MGKSTISMAIFNSYVKLPEGRFSSSVAPGLPGLWDPFPELHSTAAAQRGALAGLVATGAAGEHVPWPGGVPRGFQRIQKMLGKCWEDDKDENCWRHCRKCWKKLEKRWTKWVLATRCAVAISQGLRMGLYPTARVPGRRVVETEGCGGREGQILVYFHYIFIGFP